MAKTVTINNGQGRPMEGLYLRDALKKLAEISAIAESMRYSLDPLSEEDIELGAEPLTPDQMMPDLERIFQLVSSFALEELQATSIEWHDANDAIG